MTYPLEPSSAEMRHLADEAMQRIVRHIESLPGQPAANTEGAAKYARTLVEPLPRRGESYERLLDLLFDELIPRSFTASSPGYLAYIPGGGIFHAAIADLISDAVNRYTGVFAAAPALAQIEANVIRWLCEIVGYPPSSSFGILTTGGSLANFTAVVTARKKLLPEDFLRGTLYCSDQVHHSFQKAANLAGFPYANIREIPSDERFRMCIEDLDTAIARDRRDGWIPFLVVGSAGTTNTGAVDDLERLGDVAARENLWLHVDGAYGAFFMLTERGRSAMRGISAADSIVLDPHKTLFLPYGTGGLLVRDGSLLRRAHSAHADYLPEMQEEELLDFCEISPELSRPFRGLRVWLPLKMFGIEPFIEQLDEKLDLIEYATEKLRRIDGIEIVAEPQLTVVAFRFVKEGADLNALNRDLLDRINARKRVFLTPTIVGGLFVIRICIVSFRTHRDRVDMALDDIRAAVDSVR